MITHFEAVFLREKGLPTACINWIATKTLHVELFFFRWSQILRQSFEDNWTSYWVKIALLPKPPPSLDLYFFLRSHSLRQSNLWGMELPILGKNCISTKTDPNLWLWNCHEDHTLWGSLSQGEIVSPSLSEICIVTKTSSWTLKKFWWPPPVSDTKAMITHIDAVFFERKFYF